MSIGSYQPSRNRIRSIPGVLAWRYGKKEKTAFSPRATPSPPLSTLPRHALVWIDARTPIFLPGASAGWPWRKPNRPPLQVTLACAMPLPRSGKRAVHWLNIANDAPALFHEILKSTQFWYRGLSTPPVPPPLALFALTSTCFRSPAGLSCGGLLAHPRIGLSADFSSLMFPSRRRIVSTARPTLPCQASHRGGIIRQLLQPPREKRQY